MLDHELNEKLGFETQYKKSIPEEIKKNMIENQISPYNSSLGGTKFGIICSHPKWIANSIGDTFCHLNISLLNQEENQSILIKTCKKYNNRDEIKIEEYPKLFDVIIVRDFDDILAFNNNDHIWIIKNNIKGDNEYNWLILGTIDCNVCIKDDCRQLIEKDTQSCKKHTIDESNQFRAMRMEFASSTSPLKMFTPNSSIPDKISSFELDDGSTITLYPTKKKKETSFKKLKKEKEDKEKKLIEFSKGDDVGSLALNAYVINNSPVTPCKASINTIHDSPIVNKLKHKLDIIASIEKEKVKKRLLEGYKSKKKKEDPILLILE